MKSGRAFDAGRMSPAGASGPTPPANSFVSPSLRNSPRRPPSARVRGRTFFPIDADVMVGRGRLTVFLPFVPPCLVPKASDIGRVDNRISATRFKPGSQSRRDVTEPCPISSGGQGRLHEQHHGVVHAREVVKVCHEVGNVCRFHGN